VLNTVLAKHVGLKEFQLHPFLEQIIIRLMAGVCIRTNSIKSKTAK
jgi:hypothetical protein